MTPWLPKVTKSIKKVTKVDPPDHQRSQKSVTKVTKFNPLTIARSQNWLQSHQNWPPWPPKVTKFSHKGHQIRPPWPNWRKKTILNFNKKLKQIWRKRQKSITASKTSLAPSSFLDSDSRQHSCFFERSKNKFENLEPEIVLQTYQGFKKLMEQAEILVDVMTQSESTQVVELLEEAEELTSMKFEIMQTGSVRDSFGREQAVFHHYTATYQMLPKLKVELMIINTSKEVRSGTLFMQPRTKTESNTSPITLSTRPTAFFTSWETETFEELYHPMRTSKTRIKTQLNQSKRNN